MRNTKRGRNFHSNTKKVGAGLLEEDRNA